MNKPLRKLRCVLGIALTWGLLWATVAFCMGTIIGIVDPDSIDPGEEPVVLAPMIGLVGFVFGVVFGGLLAIAERGKTILEFSLSRAVMWGFLVSAAFPVLAGKDIRMMLLLGPLGAVSATASVGIMRKWVRWRSTRHSLSRSTAWLTAFIGAHAMATPNNLAQEVIGFSPENGQLLWRHPHATEYGLAVSQPVWGPDNILFVSSAYGGGSRALELRQAHGKNE